MMRYISSLTKILIGVNVLGLIGCSSLGAANVPASALTPTSAPSPTLLPFTGKIAFVSYDSSGNSHINVMNADGSGLMDITPPNLTDIGPPAWSSDGQYIAFSAKKDGTRQIFIVKSDGSSSIQLTFGKNDSFTPAWSPDGQYIAFAAKKDGVAQIFKIKPDGSGLRQLTFGENDSFMPLWSPDGKSIMFELSNPDIKDPTGVPGAPQIYIMSPDGSGMHRLVVKGRTNGAPTMWGSWGSYRKDGLIAIEEPITRYAVTNYIVNSEGVIQNQFPEFATESPIAWSPDGNFVAYSPGYRVPGCFGIVVKKFDQSEQECLLDQQPSSSIYFGQISWSPDGKYILFSSNLNGDYHLYVIRPDGSQLTQLTTQPGHEDWAVWWSEP